MPSEPVRSILLGAHSQYRGVMNAIARQLKERHGAAVHLYCASAQEEVHYRRRHGAFFDTVTVDNVLHSGCRAPVADAAAEIAEARRNEADLGVTYNRLAMSDRHLGRGYALAGFKHPRSHVSRETGYPQLVQGYNRAIDFWRRQIADKRPDLVVNCGKLAAVVARAEGLPYRHLAGSRYRNLHYWAVNEFFENPAVEAAYRRLTGSADLQIAAPYDTHLQMRRRQSRSFTLPATVRSMARAAAQQAYWRVRGYEKARSYYLRENLGYLWRRYRDRIRMSGGGTVGLADLEGQPFVYYPLHTEPETALQTLSPEYFYQLSSIAALSRDLPAGVVLAVKETFAAMGRRPSDFHEQIREFKNVVMLDIGEFGLQCARQADATATITGTGGFEAAVMGRPVITFGRHNRYNFLPHVMVVEDESLLAGFLARVFDGGIDAETARIDGLRFLQAVVDTSFDLGGYRVTHPDDISGEAAAAAFDALVASLVDGGEARPERSREAVP